jgi:hypothetical protein
MSDTPMPGVEAQARSEAAKAFARADLACHFGPSFFLHYLASFVRDHCPDPGEHLPAVELRLLNSEVLRLCHVVGVSPRWVLLAVPSTGGAAGEMAVELLPYEVIGGVRIRPSEAREGSIGFHQVRPPTIIAPEALLQAVMVQERAAEA